MHDQPRLTWTLARAMEGALPEAGFPPAALHELPETIVQFGTGAFLRGFMDDFVDAANRRGAAVGAVVAIGSTGSGRDAALNEQGGLFTLVEQGIENGVPVWRHRVISSIRRALSATDEWDAVLAVARAPDIRLVVSNTTEVGIALDAGDTPDARPPRSFPGKLTRFLFERARAFGFDRARGVVVLPCELIEENGAQLRRIVLELATRWSLDTGFRPWLETSCTFCDTLVDRIVTGMPPAEEAQRLAGALGYRDDLLTVCEPYRLLAIQGDAALRARLGFAGDDATIVVEPDITPYRLRKVRLLNGAHTALVSAALLCGLETVHDAVVDERLGDLLRRILFEEVAPALDVEGAGAFAHEVLERFANPFIQHALADITLHGTAKMRVRVVPSILAHVARTGRAPASLAFGFAAYLLYMRADMLEGRRAAGQPIVVDVEGARVTDAWRTADSSSEGGLRALVERICSNEALWRSDLTRCAEFAGLVTTHLVRACRDGVPAALDAHLLAVAARV